MSQSHVNVTYAGPVPVATPHTPPSRPSSPAWSSEAAAPAGPSSKHH